MQMKYVEYFWHPTSSMHIGDSYLFTNKRINSYLLGHQQKNELFNLAKSSRILTWQVVNLVKVLYKHKSINRKLQFLFASQSFDLTQINEICAKNTNMLFSEWPWIPGTITAKTGLKKTPICSVISDVSGSPLILQEAFTKLNVVIGIVNSDEKNLFKVSHPIFGNSKNLSLCKFVSLLLAKIICKYEYEKIHFFKLSTQYKALTWKKYCFRKSKIRLLGSVAVYNRQKRKKLFDSKKMKK